jgi:quercetin dioxygenase-like cupin family protein
MARSGHFDRPDKNDPKRRRAAIVRLGRFRFMQTTHHVPTVSERLAAALVLTALFTPTAIAQSRVHVIENTGTAKWGPAPAMLPPGAQIAVLAGDPTKAGPYTVRLKFPANYDIPAHSHPTDENVAVVSGEFFVAMGAKLDRTSGTGLRPGGFGMLPANMNHFAYSKTETTILLYGQGPVDFKYVNPADDPRTKTTSRK